nr:hypothetical protein [Tanacetum cinerariifolium]
MAFVSSPSPNSTNEVPTDFRVSTASPQVSTANLSDATMYAFLANQPNRSQMVHEDLEQIHEDDLEEMDLKWQLALLSMRAKRVPRNKENRTRNQETTKRTVNVEDISSKAMVAINEAGFDWSYMANDEAPTNMAFMAFSDSEVYTDNTCSKTCLKNYEALKTQYDELRVEINKSECNLANYKRGLSSVEEQLVRYKKNESLLNENIDVLKMDILIKDSEIVVSKKFVEPNVKSYGVKPIEVVTQTSSVKISEPVKENNGTPLIEDWESEGDDEARCKYHQRERMVNGTNHSRVNPTANTVSKAVLTRTGLKPVNYVRPGSQEFDGGYVAFEGGAKGGKITGKGITQNCVLFTNTKCFVLSHDFKLANESHVLLKVPRKNNMYSVDMQNIVPKKDLTCLDANATNDELMLWHRRLGHIYFKNINKLVKENLVRGLF